MRDLFELAKQQVGAVKVVVNKPNAQVFLDSQPVGTSPLASNVYVDVGPHVLNARLGDAVAPDAHIDALAGRSYAVELTIEGPPESASPAPLPPTDPSGGSYSPPDQRSTSRNYAPAIVAASVGGVALVGGIASLVVSLNKHADAQHRLDQLGDPNACGPGMSPEHAGACREIADQANSAHTFQALSFVGFGTALAAGAITYVLWPRSGAHTAALEPHVNVSRDSFVAALRGSF
jgi:hypothetical protein